MGGQYKDMGQYGVQPQIQQAGAKVIKEGPQTMPLQEFAPFSPEQEAMRKQMISKAMAGAGAQGLYGPELQAQTRLTSLLGMDPSYNPYAGLVSENIQAQARQAALTNQDLISGQLAAAQGGVRGGSSPWINAQAQMLGDLGESVAGQLGQMAYNQYNQNIGQQLQALPYAMQMGNIYRTEPLNALNLMQQGYGYASIPQQYQQQLLNARYQQQLGQLEQNIAPYQILAQLAGAYGQPTYTYEKSPWETWGQPLTSALIGAGGSALGGYLSRPTTK